jgi:hypothetical protein
VILEPAAVRGGEPPWFAILEVVEDRPRPAEDPPVLRLQHGDVVGSRQFAESDSLPGPRLHLADDGVDAELGQNLAHRGGKRAPLGLVQSDEGVSHQQSRPSG